MKEPTPQELLDRRKQLESEINYALYPVGLKPVREPENFPQKENNT